MKLLVFVLVFGWACAGRADVPGGVTARLARFILDGCDYLGANSPVPHKPDPPDRKLATHFGRVVKTQKRGIALEYVLKTDAFQGWDIAYWIRGVDLKIPPTVAITMGELSRFLGREQDVDVDRAMSATSTGNEVKLDDRLFEPPGHGVCRVFVRTESDTKKGADRRVFTLRFVN